MGHVLLYFYHYLLINLCKLPSTLAVKSVCDLELSSQIT